MHLAFRGHAALATTTALALVTALPAQAAEWEVRVGGYFETALAYASVDGPAGTDFDGVDSKQNNEIWFLPSITLDNGIKIGANIQLEGLSAGDQIDESFIQIDGSFGRIVVGSENSAGYLSMVTAPDVSFDISEANSGSLNFYVPFTGAGFGSNDRRGTLGSTLLENVTHNDAQRFTYYTPRFEGFQLGVSYARDARQDDNSQVDRDAATLSATGLVDIFDIGASYKGEFGDFTLDAGGRWGIADGGPGPSPQIWGAGIVFGYAGFSLGGSFAEQNNGGVTDGTAWDVGVSYEFDAWALSFTYFSGRNLANEAPAVAAGEEERLRIYDAAVRYKLATGITLHGFGAYVDFEEGPAAGNNDLDGWVVGTGVRINF